MPSFDPQATCSWLHRQAGLRGSAPHERAYVVVECSKPWQSKAQKSTGFPAEIGAALAQLKAEDVSFNVLATPPRGASPVSVYRRRNGVTLVDRFDLEPHRLRAALVDRAVGQPAEPELFVCTHGARDGCCARRGVPLLAALREAGTGRRLTESSHLGGHRFAPVVLAFPEWRFFGRLEPGGLSRFVEVLQTGAPLPEHYRGAGYLPPPVQVVEAAALDDLGRVDRARLRDWEVRGERHTVVLEVVRAEQSYWYRGVLQERSYEGVASCRDLSQGKCKLFTDYSLQAMERLVPESI